jgi:RecA-family ATPase
MSSIDDDGVADLDENETGPISPDDQEKPKQEKPKRFTPIWLTDIEVDDDPPYLVDGLLPLGPSVGVTFGAPGALKSFFLMHVLLHVAAGVPFCGRTVMQGAVLYITSEGVGGVKRRLVAMREHLGLGAIPFGLIPVVPNLGTGTADRDVLIRDIKDAIAGLDGVPLRAIVIDTVRRAIPGKAENKQEDMSVFVDNIG